jgi:ribosomal protein L11 methylase PrmA
MVSGDSVADIGTGTGILSVAAKLLGASEVFASDIYPPAEATAKATFAANNVDVEFSTETWPPKKVDLVICSIGDTFVAENRGALLAHGKKVVSIANDYTAEVLDG